MIEQQQIWQQGQFSFSLVGRKQSLMIGYGQKKTHDKISLIQYYLAILLCELSVIHETAVHECPNWFFFAHPPKLQNAQ